MRGRGTREKGSEEDGRSRGEWKGGEEVMGEVVGSLKGDRGRSTLLACDERT